MSTGESKEKSKIEGKWSSQMTCVITNLTGSIIENLVVWHVLSDRGDNFGPQGMYDGESQQFPIRVGSGGSDYWSVDFYINGEHFSRTNKKCDVDEDDAVTNQPVRVILYNRSNGFSIQMPSTSSCNNNSYD